MTIFLFQPIIDAIWIYFALRALEVKKTGGDWRDIFLFGDGFKIKQSPPMSMWCFDLL